MKVLFRSNDPVRLSFAEAVLRDRGIEPMLLDLHMSVLDGSIGALPRRLAVADEDYAVARKVLVAAGVLDGEDREEIERRLAELGPLTDDRLLNGRIRLLQPKNGFRAAIDSVLLPAAINAANGKTVLDAGLGAGAATLCLLAREPGLSVTGYECQEALCALAEENARRNSVAFSVETHDILQSSQDSKRALFDQVMTNPPYFEKKQGTVSPNRSKARASVMADDEGTLALWIAACLAHLNANGTFTLIHRADRMIEIMGLLSGIGGAVTVLPFLPRAGEPAHRIIVQLQLGERREPRILPPFVLHGETEKYTEGTETILRHAAAIDLH